MKRFTILGAVLTLVLATAAAAIAAKRPAAVSAAPSKITICHKTGAGTFEKLTVSSRAVSNPKSQAGKTLYGHLRHIGDVVIPGIAVCPSASTSPEPSATPAARITICHKTGSESNPYRKITISSRAVTNPQSESGVILRGHLRHKDDLIMPGITSCPTGSKPGGGQTKLSATLQPVAGATGGGTFSGTVKNGQNELCYTLTVTGLTNVTAAHIHRVSTGAIVIPLSAPTTGSSSGCVTVDQALLSEVLATPGAFYVNVHTTAYPDGQVRGNLSK